MGRRIWGAILLKFAMAGLAIGVQRAAQGAEAGVALPQFAPREAGSLGRQPSYGAKRRKPRMAGVPGGAQAEAAQSPPPVASVSGASAAARSSPPVARVAADEGDLPDELAELQRKEGAGGRALRAAPARPGVADEEEVEPEKKYGLAPIRWRGTVSAGVTMERGRQTQPGYSRVVNSLVNTEAVGVQAMSFIMKPWIASVMGGAGLSSSRNNGGSRTLSLSGNGGIKVFPRSRFPFGLSYSVSDSKSSNGMVTAANSNISEVVSKNLNVSQAYRPRSGFSSYSANYNRRVTDYKLTQDGSSNTLWSGNYSTKVGAANDQPFRLSLGHQTSYAQDMLRPAVLDTAQAQHAYAPADSLLTLNTTADYSSSRLPFTAGTDLIARNLQVETLGSWEPEELDVPLVVTGRARFDVLQTGPANQLNKSRRLTTTLSATYDAWTYLKLQAGANLSATKASNRPSQTQAGLSGRATYRPPSMKIGEDAAYGWGANGGFSVLRASTGSASRRVNGGASHSLSTPFSFKLFDTDSVFSTSVGQSLTASAGTGSGFSGVLGNNAGVSWSPLRVREHLPKVGIEKVKSGGVASLVNSLSLSMNDTRAFGRSKFHTQSVKLGGSLAGKSGYQASGYGAEGHVSVEAQRQINGPATKAVDAGASWTYSYGYEYKYKKRNLLDVRGLAYDLNFKAEAGVAFASTRQDYSANTWYGRTNKNPYSVALTQVLTYNLGKNQAMLVGYLADEYGKRRAAVFMQLRAWRNFGN